MMYDFDDFLDDLEYYGSIILVGVIVTAIPLALLYLQYKFITGQ